MLMELVPVTVGAVKVKVVLPALVMNKPLKVAIPLNGNAVGAGRLPFKFAPVVCVTVIAEPNVVTGLPKASCTVTRGWVANGLPAVALVEGCVVTTNLLAAPARTNSVCVAKVSSGVVLMIMGDPTSVAR